MGPIDGLNESDFPEPERDFEVEVPLAYLDEPFTTIKPFDPADDAPFAEFDLLADCPADPPGPSGQDLQWDDEGVGGPIIASGNVVDFGLIYQAPEPDRTISTGEAPDDGHVPPPQITFPAATAEEDPDRDEPLRNGNAPDLRESTPDIETHPDPQWVGHKIHPLGQPAGEIAAPPSDASEDTRATERTDLGPDAAEKPIPGHPADEERPARDDSSKPQMRQSHEEPQLKGRDTDESPHTDDTCRRPIDGEHERDGIAADGETANYFAVSVNSTFIWKPFDWLRWGQIEEETSQTEQELEVLDRFSEKYYKEIRVVLTAQGKGRPPIAQVEAFNVQADDWEPVKVKHHRGLGKLGVGVAAEVTGDTIADWLPETSRDKLNDLAEIILTPETLLPKLLNHAVTGLAIHAGIPHPVAKLAGDAAEQAAEPLIEPVGLRADVADGLEGLTVTLDLAHGEITQAVVDAALDRLADRLKKSLDDTSDGGDDASEE